LCNLKDRPRNVTVEFRGITQRARLAAGEMTQLALIGDPHDEEANAAPRDTQTEVPLQV
ncbi:MAG: hypothetical protein JOZ59_04030, partial [Candidatus Eremiobacteraeota bacterium]|nr:hypothetical protein [Candidatus Eremiobacteraeota bacterium]